MKVGFVGLGKLGLPCALAIESKGHEVAGADPSKLVAEALRIKKVPYREKGANDLLEKSAIHLMEVDDLVEWAELIFIAVQTPHKPEFEGVTELTDEREDFDTEALRVALWEVAEAAHFHDRQITVAIVSTVLPGTIRRLMPPGDRAAKVRLVYNPFFIAMGTAIQDFLDPEFVLLGADNAVPIATMVDFYRETIGEDVPIQAMSIESAELTKVAYNTFIGAKLAFVNTLAEICHKTPGANVGDVTRALRSADKRLISGAYMEAGMGDGGGCHCRDNIAMSWLARKLNLGHDFFEAVMLSRQHHSAFLAALVARTAHEANLDVIVLGRSFKPETDLLVGSPATLLVNQLRANHGGLLVEHCDHHVDGELRHAPPPTRRAVYMIATKHECYQYMQFPEGSIVIDPWGYIPDQEDIQVIGVGRND